MFKVEEGIWIQYHLLVEPMVIDLPAYPGILIIGHHIFSVIITQFQTQVLPEKITHTAYKLWNGEVFDITNGMKVWTVVGLGLVNSKIVIIHIIGLWIVFATQVLEVDVTFAVGSPGITPGNIKPAIGLEFGILCLKTNAEKQERTQ